MRPQNINNNPAHVEYYYDATFPRKVFIRMPKIFFSLDELTRCAAHSVGHANYRTI